jgi:Sec-independent protein translocase protein TatA
MKGLGKGVKTFKDGMEGMEDELKKPSEKTSAADQTEKKA